MNRTGENIGKQQNVTQPWEKKGNAAIHDNMDKLKGHCAKCRQSRENKKEVKGLSHEKIRV